MNLNNLTIIIPTKNEEKNIITFLDSLPKQIKLIVVDSSTDRTRELINIRRPQNTDIIFEECNIPKARQTGADIAVSDWLLFSDADMVFANDYFSNLEKVNPADNVGSIMGAKLSTAKYKWYYLVYSFNMMLFSWINMPIGTGSNMIIRKSTLADIGGFDLNLSVSEDSDILWRVKTSGKKVIYKNTLKVYEMDPRRLNKGIIRKYLQGTFRLLFLMLGFRKKLHKSDWGYWKNNEQ